MSDPIRTERRMTVEEFLNWDDGTGISYELIDGIPEPKYVEIVNGRPVAQAAAAAEHAAIVTNVGGELRTRLRGPCRAFTDAGVALPNRRDAYYKPDVMVSCTEGRIAGWIVPDPVFVVEILSPGTAGRDEGVKLANYCAIPSVQAVLLVETVQPSARLIRRVGDHWEIEFLRGTDAVVGLPFLDLELPLAEVYRGVAFEG
ncbi:MAG TPA: Uma2 family endonuclease [Azospirillum sp.]